ncbi:MAG: GWxTD domain-containing protein [Candidatus Aminicenantes bacterium]
MKAKSIIIFFICFFLVLGSLYTSKIKEKDLPQKYREWLNLVHYIILPEEREVFMELSSNRDRDLFIKTFWKQRDPTPGTPQNEFKEEHIKRFLYADKRFKRGSPREGWMTDMARIYIILGPPVSIERHNEAGLYPSEIWYYYGDKKKGLPTHFGLVFFQRHGSGEYKLYNPFSDGPAELIIHKSGLDLTDYRKLYEKIKELAPTLANMAISLVPGEYPYNFQPSPRNNIILAKIFESPKKDINPSYATHFLDYKGIVSTEYLTNYIENETQIAWNHDPLYGINFLHFSLVPKTISVDYFEPKDQYYCNFKVNVSLKKGEDNILQYSKDFPFYVSPDNLDSIKGNGIAIQDSFPVIEGEYQLNILVQNSVGKEFTVFEKSFHIPETSSSPRLSQPVLGYEVEEYKSPMHIPFRSVDKRILVDPKKTFSASDQPAFSCTLLNVPEALWESGKLKVDIQGLQRVRPAQTSYFVELKDHPYHKNMNILQPVPVQQLPPDYYQMNLALVDGGGEVMDEKEAHFIISPQPNLPRPVILAKSFPLSNNFLYFYSLAYQYDRIKDYEKAEKFYRKGYQANPDYKDGVVEYAYFLLKKSRFDQASELVETLKTEEKLQFDYYLIKGQVQMGKGQYSEAIHNLLEGNKIYNSDTRLLNSLGYCYHQTNQEDKALDALKASLSLNPEQREVKRLIEVIQKKSEDKTNRHKNQPPS